MISVYIKLLVLLLLLILAPFLISICFVAMKMAISLYRTMASLRTNASSQNIFVVILRFLENFFGSMSTGVGAGFISALISFLHPTFCIVGDEEIHILKLVRGLPAFHCCTFPSAFVISRNFCVHIYGI
uniref:Uncharacterized protein n=1 Tax=Aegilops tauschii subsp. strangulata TaxID=200361 RepID=A0A453RIT6_AEGTS